VIQHPNNFQTLAAGNQNVQRTQATLDSLQVERRCFACGEKGHFAKRCPNSHPQVNPSTATTPAPCNSWSQLCSCCHQAELCSWESRANNVVVEEAQDAPDVLLGIFFVNDTTAVMLFDCGAPHSFISAAYVEKHNLAITLLKCQMIVSSREEICMQGSYA
jgi:hypothetical protein